ncbi:hypothetical protein KJY73_12830 [Bowmanella sp. Y26]|uniref:hypothetical protein n=1 Tax=Bowmanella yangjiangensis TaxID=2811230 RepID=UPI001BDDA9EB|nr:hypothetical protein [Bowmanella yangjiangensis]MBT1064466.1 hypothetical protein [Bowmanella yangjiangensis]
MMTKFLCLSALLISFSIKAQIQITTVNQSTEELKIKSDLEFLHKEYDLTPWIYTTKIQVNQDEKVPRSHPVLTMSTQKEYLDSRVKLLSTYLHEQFHWHVIINGIPGVDEFRARIKDEFPIIKVGFPYGSNDEGNTLSHIIVCYLEYIALSELIGQEKAQKNLSDNSYYTWVYETILEPGNRQKLDRLLEEFGLDFRAVKGE